MEQTKIYFIATKPSGNEKIHWKQCNLLAENFKEIKILQLGSVGETESEMDNLDMMLGIIDDKSHALLLGIYKGSKNKIIL